MTEDTAVRRVGPYRLTKPLGEGGMGVVYRAAGDDGRTVALKLLRPEFLDDVTFRRRLAREVDAMRRVHSPHVAEILDADVSGERPYIVTRFIDGQPLDDTVRATGPLSGGLLARVAVGLADALVAIHEAGIVHRDLKPSNVMLVEGAPVVIDFGIAHALDATRLTRTGMIVGTPGYLGPEVIDGGPPGPAVDVYGWAATVAFAATGRSPFGSGSLEAVLARVIAGRPDLDGVHARLEPLLRAALARDPDQRPPAVRLAALVREADIGAPPPPTVLTPPAAAGGASAPGPGEDGTAPAGGPGMEGAAPAGGPGPAGGAAAGERATGPGPAASVPGAAPGPAPRPSPPRVPLGWYKLIAYLVIVAAVAACAVLPVPGVAAAVAAAWYLRAGDSAVRSQRTPIRGAADLVLAPVRVSGSLARSTAMLVPALTYAGVVAAMTGLGFLVWGALHHEAWPAAAARWSAAAYAGTALAGPGVMAPRRQLVRLLSAAALDRRATVRAGLVAGGVTVLALIAARASAPHWWPLDAPYGPLVWLSDRVEELLHR